MCKSIEFIFVFGSIHKFVISDTHGQAQKCTRAALALDGSDDGEGYISFRTWYGVACVEIICPHMPIGACEVALFIRCSHSCGETSIGMFGSVVA